MSATGPLVHVIDDDESMRPALLRLLEAAGLDARGYASTGEFLLHPLPDRPGCLLLDLRMPGPSGLDLQAALHRLNIMLPIVFLTGHGTVAASVQAMKAGAVDFLTKPVKGEKLLDAIGRALARNAGQRAARDEASRLEAQFAALSQRERVIFELVVAGKINKQMAYELGIAERTVKRERGQIMLKLGAESVAELGRLAERLQHLNTELDCD